MKNHEKQALRLLGALATTPQKAQALSPLLFVPQILFSGLFLRSAAVPVYLRWIQSRKTACGPRLCINVLLRHSNDWNR